MEVGEHVTELHALLPHATRVGEAGQNHVEWLAHQPEVQRPIPQLRVPDHHATAHEAVLQHPAHGLCPPKTLLLFERVLEGMHVVEWNALGGSLEKHAVREHQGPGAEITTIGEGPSGVAR